MKSYLIIVKDSTLLIIKLSNCSLIHFSHTTGYCSLLRVVVASESIH